MKRTHCLKAALAASVCLLPFAAVAQSDDSFDVGDKPTPAEVAPPSNNYIDLGAEYQSTRSAYINRFHGPTDPGLSALGGLHYGQRDPWDSGGTYYFDVLGSNLGFWDRSFALKVGQQGTWGLNFSYDGIPYNATDSFRSILQKNGQVMPGVAAGSLGVNYVQILPKVGSVNSLWMPKSTNMPSNLLGYDIGLRRDVYNATGKYQLGDWTITSGWRHEYKEGTQIGSLEIGGAPSITTAGSGSGNPQPKPTSFTSGLLYFAQPVDYDTDRFDLTGAFSSDKLQAQLGYTYSEFTDNVGVFDAQNPFAFTPTTSFGGPASGVSAIYVLPPSNSAHQLKAQLGYNITPTTRLNVNFGTGLDLQNAPYDVGYGNIPNSTQTLPRSSFNGEVHTYFGNIALTAQPIPKLDLRAAYTIDERDNQSPQNSYIVNPTSTSSNTSGYQNLPFSYRHQILSLEAGYRLGGQAKLLLSDTLDNTHRTYTDTSVVTSNRTELKLRAPINDTLFSSISVAHEGRWAQNYNSDGWWKAACNNCNAEPSNFLMFMEASRQHDEAKGMLDYQPTPGVTASLFIKMAKDNYPAADIGLRNNTNFSVGPDVSWQASKTVNLHAYYTFQRIYNDQSSIYQSSLTAAPSPTNNNYIVPWNNKTTDYVHSLGANVDWQAIPEKLKVSFDYNLSYGDTAYVMGEGMVAYGGAITSPTFGPIINTQSLPDVKSLLSVVNVHAEYSLTPKITLMAGYAWERFNYKDFMQGTSSTNYANVLLPGTMNPNESVHIAMASVRFRF